jgi:hypothetical protein
MPARKDFVSPRIESTIGRTRDHSEWRAHCRGPPLLNPHPIVARRRKGAPNFGQEGLDDPSFLYAFEARAPPPSARVAASVRPPCSNRAR